MRVVQERGAQEHRVGAGAARLVELQLFDDEVVANDRQLHAVTIERDEVVAAAAPEQ